MQGFVYRTVSRTDPRTQKRRKTRTIKQQIKAGTPTRSARLFSFHREQSEKIMPRATARIQSDLRSKSIKRRGVYAQRDREVAQG